MSNYSKDALAPAVAGIIHHELIWGYPDADGPDIPIQLIEETVHVYPEEFLKFITQSEIRRFVDRSYGQKFSIVKSGKDSNESI